MKTKPFLRTSGGENLENYENLKRPWGATEKEILQHARRCEMRVFFFSLFAKFVPKDVKNGHLGKLLGSKKIQRLGLVGVCVQAFNSKGMKHKARTQCGRVRLLMYCGL